MYVHVVCVYSVIWLKAMLPQSECCEFSRCIGYEHSSNLKLRNMNIASIFNCLIIMYVHVVCVYSVIWLKAMLPQSECCELSPCIGYEHFSNLKVRNIDIASSVKLTQVLKLTPVHISEVVSSTLVHCPANRTVFLRTDSVMHGTNMLENWQLVMLPQSKYLDNLLALSRLYVDPCAQAQL